MSERRELPAQTFVVVDWRTDGRKRVLAVYSRLADANAHATALRRVGGAAMVEMEGQASEPN